MSVQIPESYRAYCTDRAVRTAVEHILGSTKALDVPADLKWDELPKFHKAVLSAHQVRCEYAIFLHELWNAVWQPAVDESERKLSPKTVAEAQLYWGNNNNIFDTYSIWEEGRLARAFSVADTMYVLGIGALVDKEVRLDLHLWDQKNGKYITNELDLGDYWLPEKIEDADGVHDYVYSKREHAPIVDSGNIDLAPLRSAAAAALAAIQCL